MGMLVSNVGWWMQMFAMGWLVVQLAEADGDLGLAPFYIGLVGLSRAVPALSLGLIAGAVADRSERRALMLRTQALSWTVMVVLATLVATGNARIWNVFVLSVLAGSSGVFDGPARSSTIPRLVPARDLMSAIGISNLAVHGTAIIGPAIAGLLFASIGVGGVLYLTAVCYVPVIVMIWLLPPQPAEAGSRERSVLQSVVDGIRHVWGDTTLRWVVILVACTAFFARPYLNLLPAFVATQLHLGAPELSILLTLTGLGAVMASLVVASVGHVQRRGLLFLGSIAIAGALVTMLGLQTSLLGAGFITFALGFVVLAFMGLSSTIMQTVAPVHLTGRVMSLQSVLYMGVGPLGQMAVGSLGTVFHLSPVFMVCGLITLTAVAIALVRAVSLRELRATPRREPTVPSPDSVVGEGVSG